jgi:LmbE family N-acetylglucosaminyl deacetylase
MSNDMKNPYADLVADFARIVTQAKTSSLGGFPALPKPPVSPDAPKALFFAPHPDDETIIGGLALRLLREANWNVINVAVTQGSKKERQQERLQELKGACDYIGFGLVQTAPNGLERVTPKTREQDPAHWVTMVKTIAAILKEHQPKVILFPHKDDWNGTHIGVHYLLLDALQSLGPTFSCHVVETEFWGQMQSPNLLVEYDNDDVTALVTATSFHVGEVQRNPYHLLIPAWMLDNVRRGAELVGGQGGAAPTYTFGQLYRVRKWENGKLVNAYEGGRNLSKKENPAVLFL